MPRSRLAASLMPRPWGGGITSRTVPWAAQPWSRGAQVEWRGEVAGLLLQGLLSQWATRAIQPQRAEAVRHQRTVEDVCRAEPSSGFRKPD